MRYRLFLIVSLLVAGPIVKKVHATFNSYYQIPGYHLLLTLVAQHPDYLRRLIYHVLHSFLSSDTPQLTHEVQQDIHHQVIEASNDIIQSHPIDYLSTIDPSYILNGLLWACMDTRNPRFQHIAFTVIQSWIKSFKLNIPPTFRNQFIQSIHLKSCQRVLQQELSQTHQAYYHHVFNTLQRDKCYYGPLIRLLHVLNHATHYEYQALIQLLIANESIANIDYEDEPHANEELITFDLLIREWMNTVYEALTTANNSNDIQLLFNLYELLLNQFPEYGGYLMHYTLNVLIDTSHIDGRYYAIRFLNLLIETPGPHRSAMPFSFITALIKTPERNFNKIAPILLRFIQDALPRSPYPFSLSWKLMKGFFEHFKKTPCFDKDYNRLLIIYKKIMDIFYRMLDNYPNILLKTFRWEMRALKDPTIIDNYIPAYGFMNYVFYPHILRGCILKLFGQDSEKVIHFIKMITHYHPKLFEMIVDQCFHLEEFNYQYNGHLVIEFLNTISITDKQIKYVENFTKSLK